MRVEKMALKLDRKGRALEMTFTGKDGKIVELTFFKREARQFMRAIFLQIGVDPKLGTGRDTLPDFAKDYGGDD